jgi:HSP20 family protein
MSAALTPWRPAFGMMEPLRKEMEDLFERFFGDDGKASLAWAPRVDVKETDKEIVVKADVPGVDPKDVEVTVEKDVLTIRGEKKEEKEEKGKGFHRVERHTGSFYRAVALPAGVDATKVAATSSNGVVTITISKKAEAQPKKIPVTPTTPSA